MYLVWKGEVPSSWWPVAKDKPTDVLGQRWGNQRGQRQKGGTSPAVMLEKWSQFRILWLRVCPCPQKDLLCRTALQRTLPLLASRRGSAAPQRQAARGAHPTSNGPSRGTSASTAPRAQRSRKAAATPGAPQPLGTQAGRHAMPEKFCELLHHTEQL